MTRFAIVAVPCTLAAVAVFAIQASPPPGNLWAAQDSARQITLVWSRVPGAVQYRVYEDIGQGTKMVGRIGASGEQFSRPVSAFAIEHRYSIDAIFENGTVSARVAYNVVVPRETAPGAVTAPTSVQAAQGNGGISVTWSAVPGATGYRIARSTPPGGFQPVCRLCPTEPKFVDTTAAPGARHVYMVTAVAPSGVSRPTRSNEIMASGNPVARAPQPRPASTPTPDTTPPKGTIQVSPVPSACLSIGKQGNMLVRVGDGSVRFFERVHFERGMRLVPNPTFQPVAGITNAVAVATSGAHSLILLSDGTLRAFGMNGSGQLGNTAGFYSGVPLPVRGITNAVAIAAGEDHSVALLADGTIRIWGSGGNGIPGDGQPDVTTNRTLPATVAGITNAKSISSGVGMTVASLVDGTVRAWGSNFGGLGFYGVLGTGETGLSSATPRPVIGISNAIAISTSGVSSLALLSDGRVLAWGVARSPLRGEPESFLATRKPAPVPGIRNAVAVSPFLILLADGTVRELFSPERPVDGIRNAVAITSDPTNKYALLADGRLVGWGLKQFWPKGMVTVAEFGAETARECAPKG